MNNRTKINWWALLGFIVGVELVGNIGSLATFSQITTWYAALNKPWFNPPTWLFGPAWTILFALMGIALYMVWVCGTKKAVVRDALYIFALQMALNVLWSFIFFGWHQPGWAFLEIIIMWLAILWAIIAFGRICKSAGWVLVPYLAWVTFASTLNYAVWQLN